jgi:hypothetical protein
VGRPWPHDLRECWRQSPTRARRGRRLCRPRKAVAAWTCWTAPTGVRSRGRSPDRGRVKYLMHRQGLACTRGERRRLDRCWPADGSSRGLDQRGSAGGRGRRVARFRLLRRLLLVPLAWVGELIGGYREGGRGRFIRAASRARPPGFLGLPLRAAVSPLTPTSATSWYAVAIREFGLGRGGGGAGTGSRSKVRGFFV